MYYFINQIMKKDCAFASLKILLANVYKRKDFLYLLQEQEDKAYSLKDIINVSKKYGVILKGYKTQEKEEFNNFDKKKQYLIVINENNLTHMIVLLKFNKKYATIADPSDCIKKIKMSELINLWTGEFLEIEEVNGSDFKLAKVKDKNKKFVIFSLITKLISFISLSFGLYSCNKEISFYIPLIFFIIFALLSLVDKFILIKGMKEFDNNIIYPSYLEKKKNLENTMISMTNYKKITFSAPLKLFEALFILLFSTIILGFNSYLNVVNIGLICIFQACLFFIFNNYSKQRKRLISSLENKIINVSLDEEELKETLEKLNKEAYNLAILYDIKKYVGIFLSIVLAMIIFGFNDTSGLNFILFHASFYYLINEYFEKVINYGDEYNYYKMYKCQYMNIIRQQNLV